MLFNDITVTIVSIAFLVILMKVLIDMFKTHPLLPLLAMIIPPLIIVYPLATYKGNKRIILTLLAIITSTAFIKVVYLDFHVPLKNLKKIATAMNHRHFFNCSVSDRKINAGENYTYYLHCTNNGIFDDEIQSSSQELIKIAKEKHGEDYFPSDEALNQLKLNIYKQKYIIPYTNKNKQLFALMQDDDVIIGIANEAFSHSCYNVSSDAKLQDAYVGVVIEDSFCNKTD